MRNTTWPFVTLRGIVRAPAIILLFGGIALAVRLLDHGHHLHLPVWLSIVGPILLLIGLVLVLVALETLTAAGGTAFVLNPPATFVTHGLYQLLRNPIYVGQVFIFLGLGLFLHSRAVLLFSIAWLIFLHLFLVFVEEPQLRRRYGTGYDVYCQSTSRWLPRIRPRS